MTLRRAAILVLAVIAFMVPLSTATAGASASEFIVYNPPSFCFAHDGQLLVGYARIDNLGAAWTASGNGCSSFLPWTDSYIYTEVNTFKGIYGGTITLCASQNAFNPYGSNHALAQREYNQFDCGSSWYYGDNYSSVITYGGTSYGDLLYDLQHS